MLKSYIDEFIEDEVMDEKASSTYNKYRKVVSDFVDFFDKEDVAKSDLISYKKKIVENFSYSFTLFPPVLLTTSSLSISLLNM